MTSNNSTECVPYTPFNSDDYANVAIASAVTAFLSLLACCFVVFILVLFKKWKYFSQRLILYLALAGILTSLSSVVHRVDYENQMSAFYLHFCTFAGFFEQITSWMFFNAISSITIYLFANVVLKKETMKLEALYIFFIFIFPLTFSWIPFIHSSYGRSGAWCWIRSHDRLTCQNFRFGQWLIFILWYMPLYIILVTLIILYVIILFKLHRNSKQWTENPTKEARDLQNKTKQDLIPLMAYPFIYFILSIPAFINRVWGIANPDNPALALWYLTVLTFPLVGGLIALAYSLDPGTRKRLNMLEIKTAFKVCFMGEKDMISEYSVEYVRDASISTKYFTEHSGNQASEVPRSVAYREIETLP